MFETSPRRSQLSIAMIVRNAAELIEETIESIRGIADEIVVLDTGSTDETQRVAYGRATKLIRRSWDDDFSAARNACLAEVSGEWVLWLDAGESISAAHAEQLRQFIDHDAQIRSAYALIVRVPQYGANIAGEQIARIRLMPNLPGIAYAGRIRESVEESLARKGISVEGLPYRIERGSREHETQVKIRKARRNIMLADLAIKEHGPTPRMLNCIGDALQTLGDNSQSSQFFQQALSSADSASVDMLEAYYGMLTTLDADVSNRPAQLALCLRALETFPLDSQLLCAMGGYLQMQGRLDLASRAYQTAYQHGTINPASWHLDDIREIAVSCHGLALQMQNNHSEARRVLETAAHDHRDSARINKHLIDLYVKQGLKSEAMAQARLLPTTTANLEGYRNAVRGACLANDRNWVAARAYLEAAYHAGCREPLCLRWLTMTLVSLGDRLSARTIIDEWRAIEPMNLEMRSYLDMLQPHDATPRQENSATTTSSPSPDQSTARRVRLDSAPKDVNPPLRGRVSPPTSNRPIGP